MSSVFERLQKAAQEKKKSQLELVRPIEDSQPINTNAVNREPEFAVNQDNKSSNNHDQEGAVNHIDNNTDNHTQPIVKNHTILPAVNTVQETRITTSENAVNNLTVSSQKENLSTTKTVKRGKQTNKSTTQENVVNQNKRDWSTTDKRRGEYSQTVESFRTSEDFKRKVKVFCAENGIDKQDFYRIVVNHYFETAVNQNQNNAVNLLTHDDLRLKNLYKTRSLIINLYLRYNSIFNEKTKWTVRDDDAGQKINDLDLKIIELGIIQTQANKRFEGKINSFSYYLPEIQNFADLNMSDDVLTAMLDVNRRRWQQQTGKAIDLEFLNGLSNER